MDKNRNASLQASKDDLYDEYYTLLEFIEKELPHYHHHLKNKIIYCNCDNPLWSNFWKYFHDNFHALKLKKLIATYYEKSNHTFKWEYDGQIINKQQLNNNGDFRSPECQNLLAECDIVVTNPPFTIFNKYAEVLLNFGVDFLIVGNIAAIFYKHLRPPIQNGSVFIGSRTRGGWFRVPDGYDIRTKSKEINGDMHIEIPQAIWFTTLDFEYRWNRDIELTESYDPLKYPKFDNYDAINVESVKEIPMDYNDNMGVPGSFLTKHNPNQFDLVGIDRELTPSGKTFLLNGKHCFSRVVIRRKQGLEHSHSNGQTTGNLFED